MILLKTLSILALPLSQGKIQVQSFIRGGVNDGEANETDDDELKYTSFKAGANDECHVMTASGEASLDFACDSLMPPQTWQKKNEQGPDYDLVIVGGGIGASYLASRLAQSFAHNKQELPKIALFERSERLGGRLVSAYQSGALGISVVPIQKNENFHGLPLQEYGGMRLDPYKYPLAFNAVIKMGKEIYGPENCLTVEEVEQKYKRGSKEWKAEHCPGMFVRMDVSRVRFVTNNKEMYGDYITTANYKTHTAQKYCPADIAAGTGTPYDKLIQMGVAAKAYYNDSEHPERRQKMAPHFEDAMKNACADCKNGMEGFCDLCELFPGDDAPRAILAGSGYDQPLTQTFDFIIGLLMEVVDVENVIHLHLINGGFQRFAQGLMQNGFAPVSAPQFLRTVNSIEVEGADVDELVKQQISTITNDNDKSQDHYKEEAKQVPADGTITLGFTDGGSVTAKSVFLNMLPFDMPMVKGLDAWEKQLQETLNPGLATKVVMGWNDESKAPAAVFGVTPCVATKGLACERFIFAGDNNDGWVVRQFWLWDAKTIMVYTVGAINNYDKEDDSGNDYPADTLRRIAQYDGMDALVKTIMEQVRSVTTPDLEDPDWARIQPWTNGNLNFWKDGKKELNGPGSTGWPIHRPLGPDVPVYYSNSEANPDPSLHGWAEGSLDMVEHVLPSIAAHLGLKGEIVPADYSGKMTDEEIQEVYDTGCKADDDAPTDIVQQEALHDSTVIASA